MPVSRRRWLLGLLGLLAVRPFRGVPLSLAGCAPSEPPAPDPILRVDVDEIPVGGRLEVLHLRVLVELREEAGEIRARSLLCSHQRCRVDWQPEERRYHCPCHEGLFAEDGSVVYGPPQRPLMELTVRREGDQVLVDTREAYRVPTTEEPPQDS